MPRQLCLAHGNAFVPEKYGGGRKEQMGALIEVDTQPYSELMGKPHGKGRVYRGRKPVNGIFHAPIGLQIPVDGTTSVTEVRLFLVTDFHARLVGLRLFDGGRRLMKLEEMAVAGDHADEIEDNVTRFSLDAPAAVRQGLSVAAEINWGDLEFGEVRFVSVGVVIETS